MDRESFDNEISFGEVCNVLAKLEKPAKKLTRETRLAAHQELVNFFEELRRRLNAWKQTHTAPEVCHNKRCKLNESAARRVSQVRVNFDVLSTHERMARIPCMGFSDLSHRILTKGAVPTV